MIRKAGKPASMRTGHFEKTESTGEEDSNRGGRRRADRTPPVRFSRAARGADGHAEPPAAGPPAGVPHDGPRIRRDPHEPRWPPPGTRTQRRHPGKR
ncbi:hypothetical protein IscW_ISCW002016 [Ixodes scapularis]|uniref:Uncharacterized protein n=1 Tax=Ixodes scapularis TaxID=6945 RepID=B7P9C9_IXOSC|nr:hypothetical protein IscW_ISCW002016 [Ixodes scapularis]|eukprot:XP_002403951.1 hypothetical protein IscW_ISCW002016 [Ixodes scapularis]